VPAGPASFGVRDGARATRTGCSVAATAAAAAIAGAVSRAGGVGADGGVGGAVGVGLRATRTGLEPATGRSAAAT
jgi:hypothetical protein